MLSSWPHCMVIYACASQRNPQRTGSRRLRWSWICHKPGKFVSQHYRTGRIMTSGRSWGRYTCPTVFSTIKGKNNSIFYTFCTLHSWSSEFLVWNRPAGTLHWAAWTTPVGTRPFRWSMREGWRDTGRPTSWRTKKRRETPAPDVVSLLTASPVADKETFRSSPLLAHK